MQADLNYQNFVQPACSPCHMVIHTLFCSHNENRNIHRLFFHSDYEHGYLACENSRLSSLFSARDVGKTFLAAKRDGCCRRLTDISLTSEYSFVSSSDETCTGPFTKLGM